MWLATAARTHTKQPTHSRHHAAPLNWPLPRLPMPRVATAVAHVRNPDRTGRGHQATEVSSGCMTSFRSSARPLPFSAKRGARPSGFRPQGETGRDCRRETAGGIGARWCGCDTPGTLIVSFAKMAARLFCCALASQPVTSHLARVCSFFSNATPSRSWQRPKAAAGIINCHAACRQAIYVSSSRTSTRQIWKVRSQTCVMWICILRARAPLTL